MFSTKFLQVSKCGQVLSTIPKPVSIRYKSTIKKNDEEKCGSFMGKTSRCPTKVSPGCRTPNDSVKCVLKSKEVPCEKIKPPSPSYLEMLLASGGHVQKSCENECCCLSIFVPRKKLTKLSWTDIRHIESC